MYVGHISEIPGLEINVPDVALNVVKQALVGPKEGWQGWVMRLFTIAEGGYTPRHTHPWPHINYIVRGKGTLFLDGQNYEVEPGSVAYVPGDAEHQFKNNSGEDFSFICIVPEEGDK
ncbi:MAG: cupin domain-containing protein [Chitinophagales bacterium]